MKQSIGDTFPAVCIAAKIHLIRKLFLGSCGAYFVMLCLKFMVCIFVEIVI